MNPEPIAPGFITAHHRHRGREAEPRAALRDRPIDATPSPAHYAPQPRRDAEPRRHRQLPLLFAQLKRHIQRRLAYTHLRAGCCDHHSLLFGVNILKGAYSRGPLIVSPWLVQINTLRNSALRVIDTAQTNTACRRPPPGRAAARRPCTF